jgi:hypothetical protein
VKFKLVGETHEGMPRATPTDGGDVTGVDSTYLDVLGLRLVLVVGSVLIKIGQALEQKLTRQRRHLRRSSHPGRCRRLNRTRDLRAGRRPAARLRRADWSWWLWRARCVEEAEEVERVQAPAVGALAAWVGDFAARTHFGLSFLASHRGLSAGRVSHSDTCTLLETGTCGPSLGASKPCGRTGM